MYTINHLKNPRDFLAAQFFNYKDAVKAAIRASYDDCLWTIRKNNEEIIAIVYMQALYIAVQIDTAVDDQGVRRRQASTKETQQ